MTEAGNGPVDAQNGAPAEEGEPVADDMEPSGPDLSSLSEDGRALLFSALEVLGQYGPTPGTLSDLPQVSVARRNIVNVCRALKDDERIGAKMLLCLAAVDYPSGSGASGGERGHGGGESEEAAPETGGRVEMVYFLQSLDPVRTIVLKTEAPYDDPVVPSVAAVWRAADWYEREAHDLFGVSFEGHPDLSPLLLYDDFEGHPGRKEFPFFEYREF